MELKEQINLVLSYESSKQSWRHDYGSNEWRAASRLNEMLFGMPLNRSKNCQCIEDLYFMIKHNYNSEIINQKQYIMDNQNEFKLKDGVVLQSHGHDVYTNANLTDEKAVAVLASNPKCAKFFAQLPKGWKKRAEDYNANPNSGLPDRSDAKDEKQEDKKEGPGASAEMDDKSPEDTGATYTEESLSDASLDELKAIAASISEAKGVKPVSNFSKEKGTIKYILKNQ